MILSEILEREDIKDDMTLINIGSPLNFSFKQRITTVLHKTKNYKIENHNTSILCENLLWITPPFPAHHNKAIVDKIKNYMLPNEAIDTSGGKVLS